MKPRLVPALLAALLTCAAVSAETPAPSSPLALDSSDRSLVEAFAWAKKQAMAYVSPGTDPVGLWYETGLPGRTRFSMRDTAHQAMGAQALGLAAWNLNMLRHFAENSTDARDWCSLWGIDRWGRPASVDYKDTTQFWYCLPANFDIMDACYRMFLWTGDLTYVQDPVFTDFYRHTVDDYVRRWDLDPSSIMKRKRWLNVRGELDPTDFLQTARGIPGYQENPRDYIAGIDLLSTEYAAFHDYAYIEDYLRDTDRAEAYRKKADETKALINGAWWDPQSSRFYSMLDKDYKLQRRGRSGMSVLYWNAAEPGAKTQGALDSLLEAVKNDPSSRSVEGESHNAEVLYRYGAPDVAYAQLMDLVRPGRPRQEYPEVSYSVISAIVNGLMGVNLVAPAPEGAFHGGGYTEIIVTTLSGLTPQTAWAEVGGVSIRTNLVAVRHDGAAKTTLTNQSGPSFFWQPMFAGAHETLLVNGNPVKATAGQDAAGRPVSWVKFQIGAGDSATVEAR